MSRLLPTTWLLLVTPVALAGDPVLVFPADGPPAALGLEVTTDGPSPEVAWAAFLDKLFDHFDRDGDGSLSPAEAGRVFPLPLADGRAAKPDFATLDADHDREGSRAEFRAFYRAAGFTPVAVVVRPTPAETLRLGAALFRHLDRDGDGSLSAAELRQIPALLRRFDDDEDEVLTAAELLATAPPQAIPVAGLKASTGEPPAATLRIAVGGKPTLAATESAFRLVADGSRLAVPGGTCTVATSADTAAGVRAARGFCLAQFQATAGQRPATEAAFADDPAAGVLAGLFDPADRDGDGRLTRAELEAFFDLVEAGVGCRVVVTVADRGRNLFDLVDRDGDGRLDLAELLRAGRELPNELARDGPVTPDRVPASYQLTAGRGSTGDTFGPVPLGAATKPKRTAGPAAGGPRWFTAMDRNGGGWVSAAEFPGPPALFAELDRDGDGRISPAEAAAAKP